jgi:hypothetical protein
LRCILPKATPALVAGVVVLLLCCCCRTPYNRKCAFDAGDYGLGFAANSLQLGCDCLGDVTYFDGGEAVQDFLSFCLTGTPTACAHASSECDQQPWWLRLVWVACLYVAAVVNNAAGEAVVIKNAVCLHEEDHGLSWKHLDVRPCLWGWAAAFVGLAHHLRFCLWAACMPGPLVFGCWRKAEFLCAPVVVLPCICLHA